MPLKCEFSDFRHFEMIFSDFRIFKLLFFLFFFCWIFFLVVVVVFLVVVVFFSCCCFVVIVFFFFCWFCCCCCCCCCPTWDTGLTRTDIQTYTQPSIGRLFVDEVDALQLCSNRRPSRGHWRTYNVLGEDRAYPETLVSIWGEVSLKLCRSIPWMLLDALGCSWMSYGIQWYFLGTYQTSDSRRNLQTFSMLQMLNCWEMIFYVAVKFKRFKFKDKNCYTLHYTISYTLLLFVLFSWFVDSKIVLDEVYESGTKKKVATLLRAQA